MLSSFQKCQVMIRSLFLLLHSGGSSNWKTSKNLKIHPLAVSVDGFFCLSVLGVKKYFPLFLPLSLFVLLQDDITTFNLVSHVKITVKTGVLSLPSIYIYCWSWLFIQGPGFIDLTILTSILAWRISVFYSCCCSVCITCTLNPANYWLALEILKSWSLSPLLGHHRSGSVYVGLLHGAWFALWYRCSRINAKLQLVHRQRINTPWNRVSWQLE